jgi:hypothetical protein
MRGTWGEHKGNTRGTRGEHERNTRGTQGEHEGNTRGTQGEHEGNTRGTQGEHKGNTRGMGGNQRERRREGKLEKKGDTLKWEADKMSLLPIFLLSTILINISWSGIRG